MGDLRMEVRVSIEVKKLRVNSFWWDLMVENGCIDTSESGEKTYKGYPVELDETIPDIEFEFESNVVQGGV